MTVVAAVIGAILLPLAGATLILGLMPIWGGGRNEFGTAATLATIMLIAGISLITWAVLS